MKRSLSLQIVLFGGFVVASVIQLGMMMWKPTSTHADVGDCYFLWEAQPSPYFCIQQNQHPTADEQCADDCYGVLADGYGDLRTFPGNGGIGCDCFCCT